MIMEFSDQKNSWFKKRIPMYIMYYQTQFWFVTSNPNIKKKYELFIDFKVSKIT